MVVSSSDDPGASINEWHETAVRPLDNQGRRPDGGRVTAAHTRPSPVRSSASSSHRVHTLTYIRHVLRHLHPDTDVHTSMQAVYRGVKTADHLQTLASKDVLSKACVYWRINHQIFYYIIHVLSRLHCTWGRLTIFLHIPLTLTLIPGSCTDMNPGDNSA